MVHVIYQNPHTQTWRVGHPNRKTPGADEDGFALGCFNAENKGDATGRAAS